MLCAGSQSGACEMDNGGPLTEGSVVVGIVSYRHGCDVVGYPGLYTDVAAVRDWIIQTTDL